MTLTQIRDKEIEEELSILERDLKMQHFHQELIDTILRKKRIEMQGINRFDGTLNEEHKHIHNSMDVHNKIKNTYRKPV